MQCRQMEIFSHIKCLFTFHLFSFLGITKGLTVVFLTTEPVKVTDQTVVTVRIHNKDDFRSGKAVSWHLLDEFGRQIEHLGTTKLIRNGKIDNVIYTSEKQIHYIVLPRTVGKELDLIACLTDFRQRLCSTNSLKVYFPAEWKIQFIPSYPMEGSKLSMTCFTNGNHSDKIAFQIYRLKVLEIFKVVNVTTCQKGLSNSGINCNNSLSNVTLVFPKETFNKSIGNTYWRCADISYAHSGSMFEYLPIDETKIVKIQQTFQLDVAKLSLTCCLTGFSGIIDIRWRHSIKGTMVRSYIQLLPLTSNYNRTLNLDSRTYQNIGEYACEARNRDTQWITSRFQTLKSPPMLTEGIFNYFIPISNNLRIDIPFLVNQDDTSRENRSAFFIIDGPNDAALQTNLSYGSKLLTFHGRNINVEYQKLVIFADNINTPLIGTYKITLTNNEGMNTSLVIHITKTSKDRVTESETLIFIFALFPVLLLASSILFYVQINTLQQNTKDVNISNEDCRDASNEATKLDSDQKRDGEKHGNQHERVECIEVQTITEENVYSEAAAVEDFRLQISTKDRTCTGAMLLFQTKDSSDYLEPTQTKPITPTGNFSILAENCLFNKLIDTEEDDSHFSTPERSGYQELNNEMKHEYADISAKHST